MRCSNGLRADRVDRDILQRMYNVGFRYVAIGVDAGNDRMLEVVKKGETMADIESAIKNACEIGYSIKLFFVIGNPTETIDDIDATISLLKRIKPGGGEVAIAAPMPGTNYYRYGLEKGIPLNIDNYYNLDCLNPGFHNISPLEDGELEKVFCNFLKVLQRNLIKNRLAGTAGAIFRKFTSGK